MGLMTGSGPLSARPAGTFNFEPPAPGSALYLEPTPKRVRVVIAGETIADSRRAMMLHESGHQPVYYFPREHVRSEFLLDSDRHTHCPKKGDASYLSVRVGDRLVEAVAWFCPEPIESAPPLLRNMVAFYWKRVDHWYEEDEEIFVHPRDPYARIDVIPSSSHVRLSLDGQLLAETRRAVALFESNLPPRWYVPREDVVAALETSDSVSYCPYKGQAGYHSVRLADGSLEDDLVWYYADPLAEVGRIAGLLCFYNERVDLELDGEAVERPVTHFSHAGSDRGARRPRQGAA